MKTLFLIPTLAILFAVALLIGALATAQAGHHYHSMFSAGISDMDQNKNGAVSFDEYSDYHAERLRWSFDALDTDNDEAISEQEWKTFLKMHGGKMEYNHPQQGDNQDG